MPEAPIRTITLGIAEPHPLSRQLVEQAKKLLSLARERYSEAGYEVQTVRLSTRPLFDDLANWTSIQILRYGQQLQEMLSEVGLEFCSLGTAQAARPDFPLERLDSIADLLIPHPALVATVQVAMPEYGLYERAIPPTAHIMQRLARETEEGAGNFRFALLACVEAGHPFFPAAYHQGSTSLSLGLQGASIVTDALPVQERPLALSVVTERVRNALIAYATPLVELGRQIAQEQGVRFGGIDLSPAPLGEDSIATAIERCGYGSFGSYGTLAVVGALTAALKTQELPTCGYCGLMLPVLEDAELGRRWEEGRVHIHQLLLYSAVCGTGLDTIPLPGAISSQALNSLLLDVATLALRLKKPLSARLFPVPGKRSGERTTFSSPYLTNTVVRE
jgi:uncharacterized protein (UPF0210 family)